MRDEFYEVRLSVISRLNGINEVIGVELLSDSLLPAIHLLVNEKQWRVRLAIINFMPILAQQLVCCLFLQNELIFNQPILGTSIF